MRLQRVYGYWIAKIFLSVFWKDIGCDGAPTISFQRYVSVNEGACKVIPCTFTIDRTQKLSPNVVGYWLFRKYSQPQTYCSATAVSDRYSFCSEKRHRMHLIGNPRYGDCSLRINDASEKDTGFYVFRLEDGGFKWAYTGNSEYLEVTVTGAFYGDENEFILNVQEQVTVPEGLCAFIPCTFTIDGTFSSSSSSVGYWRKLSINPNGCYDIVATNSQSDVSVDNNFQLTGNPSQGDCSLTIKNISKEDAGLYQFRFEQRTLKWSYRNKYLYLHVTDFTERPKLSLPEVLVAGEEVTATCEPPGIENCPGTAPVITWERKAGRGKGASVPDITCGKTKVKISKCNSSNITFTLSESDHGASIICITTFPALGKSTQQSVTLNVQYPPSSISLAGESTGNYTENSEFVIVEKDDNVTLNCTAKSNPPSDMTWEKTDGNVSIDGAILQIQKIKGTDAGTYICSAQNQHGSTSRAVTVRVLYPPTISITTSEKQNQTLESLSVKEGESLTLVCRVDSNPTSKVSWTWMGGTDGLNLTMTENYLVLRLINITLKMAGTFNFSASNILGSINKSINISVQHSLGRQEHNDPHDQVVLNQIRDIIISAFCGLLCGLSIALCITFKSNLVAKISKMKKKDAPAHTEENSNDLYMNISSVHQNPSTSVGNIAADEPTGVSRDAEDLHYASVNFSNQEPRPRQNTPETLYSEIKSKSLMKNPSHL